MAPPPPPPDDPLGLTALFLLDIPIAFNKKANAISVLLPTHHFHMLDFEIINQLFHRTNFRIIFTVNSESCALL